MKDVFIKFVTSDGVYYYVSVLEYFNNHQDSYQDNADENSLYKWEDTDRGWRYVAID